MATYSQYMVLGMLLVTTCSVLRRIYLMERGSVHPWSARPEPPVQLWSEKPPTPLPPSLYPSYYPLLKNAVFLHKAYYYEKAGGQSEVYIYGLLSNKTSLKRRLRCSYSPSDPQGALADVMSADAGWNFRQHSEYYAIVIHCVLSRRRGGATRVTVRLTDTTERRDVRLEELRPADTRPDRAQNPPPSVALCVKPLFEGNTSYGLYRTVEWFELHRQLGLQRFVLYDAAMEGEERQAYTYYKQLGMLHLVPFPFMHGVLNALKAHRIANASAAERYVLYQQLYMVGLNDCLHRYSHYSHLLVIDLDEAFLPEAHGVTIQDTIERLEQDPRYGHAAAYMFRNAYYFDDVISTASTSRLYYGRHLMGTSIGDDAPKAIIITSRAAAINYHSVTITPDRKYRNILLPKRGFGYIRHYRGDCARRFGRERCESKLEHTDKDAIMVQYLSETERRVRLVLEQLGIFTMNYA